MSNSLKENLDQETEQLFLKGQNLVNQARETDNLKLLDEAEPIFHHVLNKYPRSVAAIFFIACIQLLRQNEGLAQILFSTVYKADKDFINAANNLGIIYKNREWRKQAIAIYLEAIETMEKRGKEIYPNDEHRIDILADLYSNVGSCYTNNGTPDEALKWYHKSLALKDKMNRDTPRFNLALVYLEKGDYKNGWANYPYYAVVHPERRKKNYHSDENPTPKWTGDQSQVVAVLGEQGLGDELMFASILPDMMNDVKIIFDCHPRLQSMFKRAWPQLPIFGTRKDQESVWQNMLRPDAYIPLSETAAFYRNEANDFPGKSYLTADPDLMHYLPDFFSQEKKRPRIGISWTGGVRNTNTIFRTIPFEELTKLLKMDCDFVSLQYSTEDNDALRRLCERESLNNVHVFQDILDNYELTACMLEQLDFIICAPQSVVYLAGALDVTCYQLCPKRGMWQQGVYGQDMPWFRSVKNIWQSDFNDWSNCIEESKRIIDESINQ